MSLMSEYYDYVYKKNDEFELMNLNTNIQSIFLNNYLDVYFIKEILDFFNKINKVSDSLIIILLNIMTHPRIDFRYVFEAYKIYEKIKGVDSAKSIIIVLDEEYSNIKRLKNELNIEHQT